MIFETVRSKTRARFLENQLFLRYINSLEPEQPLHPVPPEVNMMKGLFYVHLYSSLEKSVNELLASVLIYISSKSVKYSHLSPPFYSISLESKLKSLKDSGSKVYFKKALAIFTELSSSNICELNESVITNHLQNVWAETIEDICSSFGLKNFQLEPRVRYTIDEVVDKRNAVAHGRESAKSVGERFRCDILSSKMEIIITFCSYLTDSFEEYFNEKHYLKPHARRHYD